MVNTTKINVLETHSVVKRDEITKWFYVRFVKSCF